MWRIMCAVVLAAAVTLASATARLTVPTCSSIPGMAINLPTIKFYLSVTDPSTCCTLCTDYKSCIDTDCTYCGAFTANASGCTLTEGGTGTKLWKEEGATSGCSLAQAALRVCHALISACAPYSRG